VPDSLDKQILIFERAGMLLREGRKYMDADTMFQQAIESATKAGDHVLYMKIKFEHLAIESQRLGDVERCERYKKKAARWAKKAEERDVDYKVVGFKILGAAIRIGMQFCIVM